MSDRSILADVLLGAAAGAAATFVMDKVTTIIYEREDDETRNAENAARGTLPPYEVAAKKAGALAGIRLSQEQRKRIGSAIHLLLGISAGAAYGMLRHHRRSLGHGTGLAYGAALWLTMDEAASTLLG